MASTEIDTFPAIARHAVAAPLSPSGMWRRTRREPLVHFLALGALIFLVAHLVEQGRADALRRIVVDDQLESRILQLQQTQSGITPTPDQLAQLVENYIDDEVMYREALRMGLDRDDEIVRRRLIQKVQFLQRDLTVSSAPTGEELRAYFDTHAQRFASPAAVEFDQLYFGPDRNGWADAEARARATYERLEAGKMTGTEQPGDAFPLQIAAGEWTRADAARLFGATQIVDALFQSTPGEWSRPVRSGYGWHLVKPHDRRDTIVPPFAQVRDQVRAAYLEAAAAASDRRQLAALRERYEIVREGTSP